MPNISSTTIGHTGRYLLSARDQHLVADATPSRGGAGEAWLAGELLLAALATCAHAVIESSAHAQGWTLTRVEITGDSETDGAEPGHYARVHLGFTLTGVTDAQATELVDEYLRICPIYGSVSRGAPVTIDIRALA